KLCRLDTPIIFIEARINLSRFVVTGCAAKTSATVTFPSLNLISLFAFCFNIWLNGVASVIGKILTSRLSLSKHLAHNLGNLLLLGKIGVFHNRRNASSRLLLLISKHLILCIYLVFRILA